MLCSLKETRSATAIEQIVGRILRLPGAHAKQHPDLNCAYAFSVSDSLPEVLNELREALESNGFTSAEAERIIIPAPQGTMPLGLQAQTVRVSPDDIDSDAARVQVAALGGKARIDSAERALNFRTMIYEPSWLYEGGFQFDKHYFGPKPGELREKTPNGEQTEEFKCAQFLDGRLEIQSWVRNLVRKASSFRLQTSTDWFYPDFVCKLTDGRVLVVEYKGKDRYTADDAEEKRAVGAVWASRSGGRCLFVMPTDGEFSTISEALKVP